jgi:hypothetical protein
MSNPSCYPWVFVAFVFPFHLASEPSGQTTLPRLAYELLCEGGIWYATKVTVENAALHNSARKSCEQMTKGVLVRYNL